jgi:hypothetical protein
MTRILAQGIPARSRAGEGVKQRCPRCGEAKTEDQYHRDKWGKPGHYCRACTIEYKRAWRLKRYGPAKPKPKAVYPCEWCGQPKRASQNRYCQQCWRQLRQAPQLRQALQRWGQLRQAPQRWGQLRQAPQRLGQLRQALQRWGNCGRRHKPPGPGH